MIIFVFAISVVHYEMLHYTAFYLGVHGLPKCTFELGVSRIQRVKLVLKT